MGEHRDLAVDAYASQPHYFDHIKPVWDLVTQGTFYVGVAANRPGKRARNLGPGPPTIVAGFADLKRTRHRTHIFVEHGAGENWGGVDPHYSGGPGRETVGLFLAPNQRVAEANGRDTVVVGSPWVEHLAGLEKQPRGDRPRVVVSFHWDNRTFDATRSTLNLYMESFGALRDSRVEVAGHAHPRIADRAERYFARAGIPFVRDFSDVVRWADFYACDNSSTLYEAAACGLGMIYLDAPWHPSGDGSWRFDKYRDIAPTVTVEEVIDTVLNYKHVSYDQMVTEIFGVIEGSAELAARAINDFRSQGGISTAATRSNPSQPSIFDPEFGH